MAPLISPVDSLTTPTCGDSIQPTATWQVNGVEMSLSRIVAGNIVRVEVAEHYPPALVVRKIIILNKPDKSFQFFIAWCGVSKNIEQVCSVKLPEDVYKPVEELATGVGAGELAIKLIALARMLCICNCSPDTDEYRTVKNMVESLLTQLTWRSSTT